MCTNEKLSMDEEARSVDMRCIKERDTRHESEETGSAQRKPILVQFQKLPGARYTHSGSRSKSR
jgi:hypothetical protein